MAKASKTAKPAKKATSRQTRKEGHRQDTGCPRGRGALGA